MGKMISGRSVSSFFLLSSWLIITFNNPRVIKTHLNTETKYGASITTETEGTAALLPLPFASVGILLFYSDILKKKKKKMRCNLHTIECADFNLYSLLNFDKCIFPCSYHLN